MRMTTTKERQLTLVRALVHGDSGVGKTTSLATLPQDRTMIAAAERGLLPLRAKNYAVAVIESWDDVRELVRMFSGSEAPKVGEKPVSVLAIDSLSELSELCKAQIVAKDRKVLQLERTKGKTDKPAGIYDDQMTMEDWGLYRTRMSNMLSAVCHLPVHVIFTCLSTWTEDKITGAIMRTPNLSGKLGTECPSFFDLVLHMEASEQANGDGQKQQVRLWRTYSDGRVIAKDASGSLDPFEVPDWTALLKKILNGGGK